MTLVMAGVPSASNGMWNSGQYNFYYATGMGQLQQECAVENYSTKKLMMDSESPLFPSGPDAFHLHLS